MTASDTPMRVMHIISGDLWAGAEVQAYTLLKKLQPHTNLYVVLMNHGELENRLREINIHVTVLDETVLTSLAIIGQLRKLIRELKPDVLHTHRQKENIFGNLANVLAVPFFRWRAKSIRTSHGAPESTPKGKQKLQVWLDTWIGNHLQQCVIAVSDDLAKKLTSIFPPDHIRVVHNGVDYEALLASAKTAEFKLAFPEYKHIGIIGRIQPVKRVDIFLETAALLLLKHQHIKFHVIGDGNLKGQMEEKAELLGITDNVVFHGHRADIASCIVSLDVIVMCSDHEGTPMTGLEALALGTPLIAHDVGGLHEMLCTQPELLVCDHSPSGYFEAINNVLVNNNYKPVLAKHYDADVNSLATLEIYKSLLN
ncbi:glycosyl transferase [Cellvibrio zantedeschiae]|uniref:Glycosyl transferase n=1 Tax=Cellvibrio zantedeschiae TaxID=1237077 RepID=A0ABQ3B7D7_9GAMM|nr:glycosyltransferase [Cellvibrio zantedeschiae]GGY82233.1 glycosyl transferase [Cellvibrio zantedeschiae]